MAALTPRQTSRNLNGKDTQVFVQTFADRILVLVTQMGKVGNLVLIHFLHPILATLKRHRFKQIYQTPRLFYLLNQIHYNRTESNSLKPRLQFN